MSNKLILTYLLGILLTTIGCSEKKKENKNREIPVRTSVVTYDKSEKEQVYVGVIEEELSSSVSFPVMGTIERLYAVEGQQVNKGTLLAELNTSNLLHTYTASKAQLEQAEDAMKRIQMLYDNESVPEIKYIEMKTNLEKARSAEAIAKKNLADSRLIAPFSGMIGKKAVETGENVLPNQTVFTLLKIDRTIMVKVAIPEKEINQIRLNQSAVVKVMALNDEAFEGVVTEKGVVADPVSHTYNVRLKVENKDKKLLPGMVCNVFVDNNVIESEMIVVPGNCIQKSGNGEKFVWLVSNEKVIRKPVETGKLTSNGIEITSGLRPGDEIITEGYQNISEGVTIRKM